MKKTSHTIVFFGNERLATGVTTEAPTLQALLKADYHVAAVVSNYERGKSRAARDLEIAAVATEHHIPLLLPSKLADIKEKLAAYKANVGILVAYGKIVPQSIIDIFPCGIINIHPSLLPLHRGPTPIENALLQGETKTGVSLMQLSKEMDAGPVYAQSEVTLVGNESKQALANQLLDIGKTMLVELLPGILAKQVVALPQDGSRASYDRLLSKNDGLIDWHKPAVRIEREIRAFIEWPKSRTQLAGKDVIITKAHIAPSASANGKPGDVQKIKEVGTIMITTGNGSLCIERLKPASKPEMTAAAFMAGNSL